MAVYQQQGTAGNIPLAAAFAVVPIVIMMLYLWFARRHGGLRCALSRAPARPHASPRPRGLLFLHLPIPLIFLYAFTTEERSYQFPPPGLTLRWFAVAWNRADVWPRARPVAAGRRDRHAARARPRHALRRGDGARALLRPRRDLAPGHPADRAARHRHRHLAALGLQPDGHPVLDLDHRPRPRHLLHRRRLQQRRRPLPPPLGLAGRGLDWTSAPTASRPSAT